MKANPENAKALFGALAKFGAPFDGPAVSDFAAPGPFFRMGRTPVGVDVRTRIPGIEFEAAWPHRVEGVIDEKTGLKATFISAEDLIAAKLASGRLQDIATRRRFNKRSMRYEPMKTRNRAALLSKCVL